MPTISPINTHTPKRISFKAIYPVASTSQYNANQAEIESAIKDYLKTGRSMRKLGEGVGGEVFVFTSPELQNLVLKRNKSGHVDDYAKEYANLAMLPSDKIGGQRAIARIYDSYREEYFLISTLAEGKPVSARSNPFTEKSLQSLFAKMFELDKRGIYHGDLNGKNVLISPTGEVSFIDYQWTQKVSDIYFFTPEKTAKMMLPIGHFPENAQMLEMAAIPKYIESLPDDNARNTFMEMYLKAKAGYHNERYKFLKDYVDKGYYLVNKDIAKSAIDAEQAKALLFENPSPDIQLLELKKIQFLSDYRDAFRHVDAHLPARNILASTSPYLCAVSSVQNFRKSVFDRTPIFSLNRHESAYLKAMAEYGTYWYHNLVKFAEQTQDYVMRMLTKSPLSHEHNHNFYKHGRSPRIFPSNRDLLGRLEQYYTEFDNVSNMSLFAFEDMLYDTQDIIEEYINNPKISHQADKYSSLITKKEYFWKKGIYFDYINTMQVLMLKLREFESYLRHDTNLPKLQRVIFDTLEAVTSHTRGVYNEILNGLKYEYAQNILTKGYEHMRKFTFKI